MLPASAIGDRLEWRRVRALLVGLDLLAVTAAFGLALLARQPLEPARPAPAPGLAAVSLYLLAWLGALAASGLYDMSRVGSGLDEYRRVAAASTLGLVAVVVASYRSDDLGVSRGFLLSIWVGGVALLCAARFLGRRLVRYWARRGARLRRVLVVGANQQGIQVAGSVQADPAASSHVCGFLDDYHPIGAAPGGFPVLGDPMRLHEVAERERATHAIVVEAALTWESLRFIVRTLREARGPQILIAPGTMDVNSSALRLAQLGRTPLLAPRPARIAGARAALERGLDLLVALLALLLAWPLLAVAAALIRLEDGGPVLHRRRVLGLHGVEFDAFKLRTMRVDANDWLAARPDLLARYQVDTKLPADPRVTRAGRVLRKLSVDEIPQFVNVLLGQMSVVGPRMIHPSELARFGSLGPERLKVKPGITGLWQVSGRQELPFAVRVEMDREYLRRRSLSFDLWLILRTIPAVLGRAGAR